MVSTNNKQDDLIDALNLLEKAKVIDKDTQSEIETNIMNLNEQEHKQGHINQIMGCGKL